MSKHRSFSKLRLVTLRRAGVSQTHLRGAAQETRASLDGARRALAGIDVFSLSNRYFVDLTDTLRRSTLFPTLFFVAQDEAHPLAVLKGHARLTAYLIAPDCLPSELKVVVGFSEQITHWGCY